MTRCASSAALVLLIIAARAAAFQHREAIGPATLEVRSDSDRPALALSEVLHVVVTVKGKDVRVKSPLRPAADASWEVLRSTESGPNAEGWQQTLTLAPLSPGDLKVEFTPLDFGSAATGEQRVTFKPFAVPVQSQIKDADLRHARDITSTEELP